MYNSLGIELLIMDDLLGIVLLSQGCIKMLFLKMGKFAAFR